MKALIPVCTRILPGLFAALVACTNNAEPLDPYAVSTGEAALETGGHGIQSVVIRTQETDNLADGSIDIRNVTTTWYDARGNPVKETREFTPGLARFRTTYRTTFTNSMHGAVLAYVTEIDEGSDGTINSRELLTTDELDSRGNPVRQTLTMDHNADGIGDNASPWVRVFDVRNRLILLDTSRYVFRYGYDARDNVVRYFEGNNDSPVSHDVHSEFTAHNALFHSVARTTGDTGPSWVTELTTLEYDLRGYPIRQLEEVFAGWPFARRLTRSIQYDHHHNVARITDEDDVYADGTINSRTVTSFEYRAPTGVPAAGRGTAGAGKHAAD